MHFSYTCQCDALYDLIPFAQFKKREKHPRSVTFSNTAVFSLQLYKSNPPP